jgi:hypothetical protein
MSAPIKPTPSHTPAQDDPTRGRSAGTAENARRDPTRGRSAGKPDPARNDPTRARPATTPTNVKPPTHTPDR